MHWARPGWTQLQRLGVRGSALSKASQRLRKCKANKQTLGLQSGPSKGFRRGQQVFPAPGGNKVTARACLEARETATESGAWTSVPHQICQTPGYVPALGTAQGETIKFSGARSQVNNGGPDHSSGPACKSAPLAFKTLKGSMLRRSETLGRVG